MSFLSNIVKKIKNFRKPKASAETAEPTDEIDPVEETKEA